jgi:hypothetical protein
LGFFDASHPDQRRQVRSLTGATFFPPAQRQQQRTARHVRWSARPARRIVPAMVDFLDVSDVTPRIAYEAAAGQDVFAVPFVFENEAHLDVYVNDVLKTLSTHYTTSGAGDPTGGSITLVTPSTLNDSVVIARVLTYELSIHIPTSGNLDIPAINLMFSSFTMMLQQLAADLPRSIRQPISDVDDLSALPVAATRASKYLAFDADGDVSLVSSVSTSVAATAFILTLMDDPDAPTARATLGITDQASNIAVSLWHLCR